MFRGSKSRNKVSVGEPAEGSLPKERYVVLVLRVLLPWEPVEKIIIRGRLVPLKGEGREASLGLPC